MLTNPKELVQSLNIEGINFPLEMVGVCSGGLTRMHACLYTGTAAVRAPFVEKMKSLGFRTRYVRD